ncbi:MAG: glycoside hydrolase family 13 protein [Clostridiales bacterium]|jgi:alpha-glucosidase|nr:glycoside hydrolase family 13 protein [Clostridiales bacterium]
MNKLNAIKAIFSDETANFISNPQPAVGEIVTISLRTLSNSAVGVRLMSGGFGLVMDKAETCGIFDFWRVSLSIGETLSYHFAISFNDGEEYIYNKSGLTDFVIIPGFDVPTWAQNCVMYQIFIDRFYNGDPSNDVYDNEYIYLGRPARAMQWNDPVEATDFCNFYGGDLAGIKLKMDYLADLGVEAIYLNPHFVSPSSHKYDIQDYDHVDPHLGIIVNDGDYAARTTDSENLRRSDKLLIELIALAHEKGIRVILDGVFNHCGAFNKWLDKEGIYGGGAYASEDSIYSDYFLWKARKWPNNEHYEAWWGHDNHPKLNFEGSPELYEKIMQMAEKWVSPPFNADGWRLDVAADLGQSREFNHKFWADFRRRVKKANPDAVILAEHYGNPAPWLDGKQWDSIMNYDAFMEPISWFFTGMQKHSEAFDYKMLNNAPGFKNAMEYFMAALPAPALNSAMNQLSNHDHSRFLTRTNMRAGRLHTHGGAAADEGLNPAIMLSAVTMQFTWPGCPTIYYGDEAGLAGWTDPDNRRPFPWNSINQSFFDFHKEIIRIHKSHGALRGGSLKFLHVDFGVLAYARWNDDESLICAINNTHQDRALALPAHLANLPPNAPLTRILLTLNGGFTTAPAHHRLDQGMLFITLPPLSSAILKSL